MQQSQNGRALRSKKSTTHVKELLFLIVTLRPGASKMGLEDLLPSQQLWFVLIGCSLRSLAETYVLSRCTQDESDLPHDVCIWKEITTRTDAVCDIPGHVAQLSLTEPNSGSSSLLRH